MAKRLLHGDEAVLDIRKIEDYCLNPSHPRGRHKARAFWEALKLQRSDASWPRDALLEAARTGDAVQVGDDAWGTHWRLEATIGRSEESAVCRTIWIVRPGKACRGSSRVGCYDAGKKARKERSPVP